MQQTEHDNESDTREKKEKTHTVKRHSSPYIAR